MLQRNLAGNFVLITEVCRKRRESYVRRSKVYDAHDTSLVILEMGPHTHIHAVSVSDRELAPTRTSAPWLEFTVIGLLFSVTAGVSMPPLWGGGH